MLVLYINFSGMFYFILGIYIRRFARTSVHSAPYCCRNMANIKVKHGCDPQVNSVGYEEI